jgi:hypothetical protein
MVDDTLPFFPPRSHGEGSGAGLSVGRPETSMEQRAPHPLPPPRKRRGGESRQVCA